MPDTILIEDLHVRCVIGVNPEERRDKQDVLFTLELTADLRPAGRSDRFEDCVDYRGLKKRIFAMAEKSEFRLLEALAEATADVCLQDARVRRVRVRVDKPGALRFARNVAVVIERGREAP